LLAVAEGPEKAWRGAAGSEPRHVSGPRYGPAGTPSSDHSSRSLGIRAARLEKFRRRGLTAPGERSGLAQNPPGGGWRFAQLNLRPSVLLTRAGGLFGHAGLRQALDVPACLPRCAPSSRRSRPHQRQGSRRGGGWSFWNACLTPPSSASTRRGLDLIARLAAAQAALLETTCRFQCVKAMSVLASRMAGADVERSSSIRSHQV
jgi:hypothetical protein